jgi:hypothetical protein
MSAKTQSQIIRSAVPVDFPCDDCLATKEARGQGFARTNRETAEDEDDDEDDWRRKQEDGNFATRETPGQGPKTFQAPHCHRDASRVHREDEDGFRQGAQQIRMAGRSTDTND